MEAKVDLQDLRLDYRYEGLKKLAGTEFKEIKKFIERAKNGEDTKGIDISPATERKYIDALAMAYKALKKPLLKTNKEDLTKLKRDLKEGKIKSRIKKPYSPNSQKEMELVLIRFLEFVNPKKYAGFKQWFVIKPKRSSVEYLKESEIEELYGACKDASERFLVAVLFDSGARASEFLNIRFEDITEPTTSYPYYKILFKEEYSKTKERNIGLYWKHSTEAIRDYLATRDDDNPKAVVYDKTYDSIRMFITRMGKRILHKRVYFHIFRKSSASYYATKLKSRQDLCYRYGWTFSSHVPDVYISREQGDEGVKDTMVNSSVEKVSKENQELKTKMALISEKSEKEVEKLKRGLKTAIKAIELLQENSELKSKHISRLAKGIREGRKAN